MHSAWCGTGLAITRLEEPEEMDSSAEEELIRLHKTPCIWSHFSSSWKPCKTAKAPSGASYIVHQPSQILEKYSGRHLQQCPLQTLLSTLHSQTDCDTVTQVVLCFMAGKACSYPGRHFKDTQSVQLNSFA